MLWKIKSGLKPSSLNSRFENVVVVVDSARASEAGDHQVSAASLNLLEVLFALDPSRLMYLTQNVHRW